MSTRTQVRIISNRHHIDLYHHYDGYFEGVGYQLKVALSESNDPVSLIEELVKMDNSYELTDALHRDIDYFYELDYDKQTFRGYALRFEPWSREESFDNLYITPNCSDATMDLKTGQVTTGNGRLAKTVN